MQNENTNTAIDYSPLYRKYSISEFYTQSNGGAASFLRLVAIVMALCTGIGVFIMFAIFVFAAVAQGSLLFGLGGSMVCILSTAVSAFGLLKARRKALEHIKIKTFAETNSIRYGEYIANPGYPGMLFGYGDTQIIPEAYRFTALNDLEIGNITVAVRSGNSSSDSTYGYIKIHLSRQLPHMVLDAVSNNKFGYSDIALSMKDSQKLSLEGDFDQYFTLYAPEQYKTDALYIFTPDVMCALVDYAQDFDIEIVDSQLLLRSRRTFNLASEEDIRFALYLASVISPDVHEQTNRYRDERVDNNSQGSVAIEAKELGGGMKMIWVVIASTIFGLVLVAGARIVLRLPNEAFAIWALAILATGTSKIMRVVRKRNG